MKRGNLKRLDLQTLFSLRLPTSQRIYRYLDKRFHDRNELEMDLIDFACGHVGLTPHPNSAIIKQRLEPPTQELEGIGFLQKQEPSARYKKVGPKIWRINLQKAPAIPQRSPESPREALAAGIAPRTAETTSAARPARDQAEEIVRQFHKLRFGAEYHVPLSKETAYARELIASMGADRLKEILPRLAKRLQADWPAANTFSAVRTILPRVLQSERRPASQADWSAQVERSRMEVERRDAERKELVERWKPVWDSLDVEERGEIERVVIATIPHVARSASLLDLYCLRELQRRKTGGEVVGQH